MLDRDNRAAMETRHRDIHAPAGHLSIRAENEQQCQRFH